MTPEEDEWEAVWRSSEPNPWPRRIGIAAFVCLVIAGWTLLFDWARL